MADDLLERAKTLLRLVPTTKPEIEVQDGELLRVLAQAQAALITEGSQIYQRGGQMVRTGRLPDGTLLIWPVTAPWLRIELARRAAWVRYDGKRKRLVPCDPPIEYARDLLAGVLEWRLPDLVGLVEAPTLRRDGTVLAAQGHDAATGIYVDYTGDPVEVPESPTLQDALAALRVLEEPLAGFAFATEADRSVALSAILTTLVRRSITTAPLHLFDAPTPGSGKSLLTAICALIATGRTASTISLPREDAEAAKQIGALLLQGASVINLDNVERPLEGDMLCSLATEPAIDVRVLGVSQTVRIRTCSTTLMATGNNLTVKGDLTRRSLICRVDPRVERPDARTFDVDLHQWVPAHRTPLIAAALTILRAYHVAGRPPHGQAPYGSFGDWDRLVRGALIWVGEVDPLATRERLQDKDPVADGLAQLLTAWESCFGADPTTVAQAVEAATPGYSGTYSLPGGSALRDAALAVGSVDGREINARLLGRFLARHEDRIVGGKAIKRVSVAHKVVRWACCQI